MDESGEKESSSAKDGKGNLASSRPVLTSKTSTAPSLPAASSSPSAEKASELALMDPFAIRRRTCQSSVRQRVSTPSRATAAASVPVGLKAKASAVSVCTRLPVVGFRRWMEALPQRPVRAASRRESGENPITDAGSTHRATGSGLAVLQILISDRLSRAIAIHFPSAETVIELSKRPIGHFHRSTSAPVSESRSRAKSSGSRVSIISPSPVNSRIEPTNGSSRSRRQFVVSQIRADGIPGG